MIFGIVAPLLVGVAGIAVDYARYNNTVANLQGLADGAAVAAVRSMTVANMSAGSAQAAVDSYVKQKAEEMAWQKGVENIVVTTSISASGDAVQVQLSQEWAPMLAHVLIGDVKTPVVIKSTAKMVGTGKACVIGLNETADKTFHADDAAKMTGNGCGIFSNSTHKNSIVVDKDAQVAAQMICSAGGALVKKKGNVNPDVTEDCPALEDPLADRVAPAVGACDYTDFQIGLASNYNLQSGKVFCGGLRIHGAAVANLQPGIYVIKDGPLLLEDTAQLIGSGVGFYLTGTNAYVNFGSGTTVSLEAPVSGDMGGLLFFEDRNNAAVTHFISSADARNLLGSIYLPKSRLEINSLADVAGDSAYTALVVNRLTARERPNITLNSDYDATNVPVPPGLIGGKVILSN
jgi:Flp pilus assembly protein TadG